MPPLSREALRYDITYTIVEDSEPEREAEKARLKDERRQRRRMAKASKGTIEIDKLSALSGPSSIPPSPVDICNVDEFQFATTTQAAVSEEEHLECPIHSSTNEPNADVDLLIRPMNLDNFISPSKEETEKHNFDLTQFAFSRTSREKLVSDPGPSVQNLLAPQTAPTGKIPRPSSLPSFASGFATQQLNGLLKCVVCDLAWTTRKTVPMKMAHIKTCARKNGWAEATVKVRLSLLFEKMSSTTVNGGKERTFQTTQPTLFEDVVVNAAPKKGRKKSKEDAVAMVLDPQDAHQVIMERARLLFAQASLDRIQEAEDTPSTQVFPPTRLGVPGSGFLGLAMDEEHEAPVLGQVSLATPFPISEGVGGYLPPPTQVFKPSALQASLGERKNKLTDEGHIAQTEESANTVLFSQKISSPPLVTSTNNYDAQTFTHSGNNERVSSPLNMNPIRTNIDSNGTSNFLGIVDSRKEYDKHTNQRNISTKKSQSRQGRARVEGRKGGSRSSRSPSHPGQPSKPGKSRSPRKQYAKETNGYFSDTLEDALRQIIKSDAVLYHKILRYEPIHIEQLMRMPVIEGLDDVGFKFKLIKFLDKHAINFYSDSSLAAGQRGRF